jgi:hypothetical protein
MVCDAKRINLCLSVRGSFRAVRAVQNTWVFQTDTRIVADVLWGQGITDIVERVLAAPEWDQSQEMTVHTESISLEVSIHPDLMQTGG